MPHLVVSISGHGFGHVAQTAPVLNRLHALMPQLRITLRTAVPAAYLRSRISAPFEHMASEGDIGMAMTSAIDVHSAASRAAYREFHENWDARVDEEAHLLHELGADLVFSNVGYLPLAGAQRAGIPNAAMCSLNWADIYRHYTGDDRIAGQIRDCYAGADAFLRVTPGMAMSDLPNLVVIAPIAEVGIDKREELDRHLGLSKEEKLVLVSMGGIAGRLPMEHWPNIAGVRWLVQENWQVSRADAVALESLPLHFRDLLASCDALLCKPGYGSFVEAACCSTPVLYVDRPDWPETAALTTWLRQFGSSREISREQLECGDVGQALSELWSTAPVSTPTASGAEEVANWLLRKLSPSG
ncbi:MAG: hypothetical protein KJ795_06640 [Gammaproteobacteria bacterium]|nr:hypothetical protein [Gammaproteobacteria bacterium]MBU1775402.1 hypothetical protein [Gammaproteobacteria bacterium]MBU1969659.1 hypothetical protein [Gammaproteobacteria bacterium]